MRIRFDEQLNQLNMELIQMGALCEEAISLAIQALLENEADLVERVQVAENNIDQKERDIERLCMKLLLQQQPVAKDLRQISSALKMISDMERIGDQALDIAEITSYIKENELKQKIHIEDMAKETIHMVTESIDSFVKNDLNMAMAVLAHDDVVDDLFSEIRHELINLLGEKKQNGEICLDLLMIAKYLERIGDHAVNIAEWVVFSITGDHVDG